MAAFSDKFGRKLLDFIGLDTTPDNQFSKLEKELKHGLHSSLSVNVGLVSTFSLWLLIVLAIYCGLVLNRELRVETHQTREKTRQDLITKLVPALLISSLYYIFIG